MHHVGLSVANLDRSVAFYTRLLDMTVVIEAAFGGDRYGQIMKIPGVGGRVALLESSDVRIELFEFSDPTPRISHPERPVCDHGITHFCVEVSDIDSAYRDMCAAGVPFHSPPLTFRTAKAAYGRDPDGNVFELLERIDASTKPAAGAEI